MASTTNVPWLCERRSSKSFILSTICMAMFTDGFVYGMVAPVIPFILQDHTVVPEEKIQLYTSYIVAAFSISDLIAGPLCAWYVDRTVSRRIPFMAGLIGMLVGCILFAVAESWWLLFLSRIMQGWSSSTLYTVGLAILVDTVEHEETGQWMGTALSCNNIGIIVSPILGGIIYDKAGRMAILGVSIALISIDVILRSLMIEKKSSLKQSSQRKEVEQTIPTINVISSIVEMYQTTPSDRTLYSQSLSSETQSLSTSISTKVGGTPESKKSRRLPGIIKLLRSPRLLTALYGCFINEFIVACLCTILPLFVNVTFHWNSIDAGLIFLTIGVPALGGTLAGHLSDKLGARWVAVGGFVLTAPSLILLRLVDHESKEQVILLCVLLVLAGSTIVFFLAPLGADLSFVTDEISSGAQNLANSCDDTSVHVSLYASSFSMMNSALAAADLIGPLFAGSLNQSYGWKAVTAAIGGICLSGAVPCIFFTGGKIKITTTTTKGVEAEEMSGSAPVTAIDV